MHPVKANGNGLTMVQIELPDATAEAAQAAGLLTSEALDRLLSNALHRRQAADWLMNIADEVAAAGVSPMPEAEIRAEVKASREARRHRAAGE
jgi:post-segregation antitoxin (ccd killing protein)